MGVHMWQQESGWEHERERQRDIGRGGERPRETDTDLLHSINCTPLSGPPHAPPASRSPHALTTSHFLLRWYSIRNKNLQESGPTTPSSSRPSIASAALTLVPRTPGSIRLQTSFTQRAPSNTSSANPLPDELPGISLRPRYATSGTDVASAAATRAHPCPRSHRR